MPVIHVNHQKDYTVMSNIHLRDKQMSLKAKGLLSVILSLPEEWIYSVSGLAGLGVEQKYSMRNILKELEELGYLSRTSSHDEKGRFITVYEIYENPKDRDVDMDDTAAAQTNEKSGSAKIHINKNKSYTVMSNCHLRDKQMTLPTKGLLSLMLSLPDEWIYSVNGLVSLCLEKQNAVRTALRELEDHGYLVRNCIHQDNGRFYYQYEVYEHPVSAENATVKRTPKKKRSVSSKHTAQKTAEIPETRENTGFEPAKDLPWWNAPHTVHPHTGTPHTVEPYTDQPYAVDQTLLNTNISNTNELNTNKSITEYIYARPRESQQNLIPTKDDVEQFCLDSGIQINVDAFMAYNAARSWKIGRTAITDWRPLVTLWAANENSREKQHCCPDDTFDMIDDWAEHTQTIPPTPSGGYTP